MLAGQIPHLSSFGQRESAQNDASKFRRGAQSISSCTGGAQTQKLAALTHTRARTPSCHSSSDGK